MQVRFKIPLSLTQVRDLKNVSVLDSSATALAQANSPTAMFACAADLICTKLTFSLNDYKLVLDCRPIPLPVKL